MKSSKDSSPTKPQEHPAVSVTRLLIAGGGALALTLTGMVNPLVGLAALVSVGMKTDITKLAFLLPRGDK